MAEHLPAGGAIDPRGIFQLEPGQNTTFTHTLPASMFYFKNPYTGKINFGNGGVLRGKDSPQSATRVAQGTYELWFWPGDIRLR